MRQDSERHSDDPGLQFVLDNRRLIVGFALLVVLCGGFFILGFVEGKRQANADHVAGPPEGGATASIAGQPSASGEAATPSSNRSDAAEPPGAEPTKAAPAQTAAQAGPRTDARASESREPAGRPAVVPRKPPTSSKVEYTIQVGAFRQRKEVDIKAAMLKAKGYDCAIEAPQAPDQLFLLQVGRFETRAEAVRMQLKLRNDGFASFIKSR